LPNDYFQFKQFKIEQGKSSMKVCTDSCLFGAWIAHLLEQKTVCANSILDIGTGTGLLSLILAQKSTASIEAVELDENAFMQAEENFRNSPYSNRVKAYHADIKSWKIQPYDLIVCNPPFYENDLQSYHQNKNLAKHHEGLTFIELIREVKSRLGAGGAFAVLLPYHRVEYFKSLAAEHELYLQKEIFVKPHPEKPFFRGMLLIGQRQVESTSTIMTIKETDGNNSAEFRRLLKDYYLSIN
jgi:tRNA1Val (adenine37-N6)-methyltransferase